MCRSSGRLELGSPCIDRADVFFSARKTRAATVRQPACSSWPGALRAPPTVADQARSHDGSIVYVRAGHIWLTNPSGRTKRRVTATAGWSSPTQSTRGVIVAQKNGVFYRLTRYGKVLSHPVRPHGGSRGLNWPGFHLFGPYGPRVSPNGKRIAYWFRAQSVGRTNDIFTYTATTSATRFDSSVRRSAVDQQSPHWIGNNRLTTSDPYGTGRDAISTWVPSGGEDHRQGWFYIKDVLAQDGALSADHTRFAIAVARDGATSPDNLMTFWSTTGPVWTGKPPYDGTEAPPPCPRSGAASRSARTHRAPRGVRTHVESRSTARPASTLSATREN